MSTLRDRRAHDLAAQATARAHQLAERWDHAAPRRPLSGHGPDCPNRTAGPMRRCGLCRAEALERGARVVVGVPAPSTSALAPTQRPAHADAPTTACVAVGGPQGAVRGAEERQCQGDGCYRPTDHHTGTRDRCRPEGQP